MNTKTIVLNVELKDDDESIKKYIEYHSDVWPEVIDDLKINEIKRMRIYIKNNLLTMILEVPEKFNLNEGIHREPPTEKVAEWSKIMTDLAKKNQEGPDSWNETKLIFDTKRYYK